MTAVKHGNFTGLAANYAAFRPGYAPDVADAIVRVVGRAPCASDAADIGAGTGIWTRMLAERGFRSVTAVEPNDEMRALGIESSRRMRIDWRSGSAEKTGLANSSVDLVSMASALHWADFDQACTEFHRILRPGGIFTALWNPRLTEENPILAEIEAHIERLKPGVQRRSSGRSGIADRLTDMLSARPQFTDVVYLEGRHRVNQTPDQFIGAWRSVNDLQAQMGPELFGGFLEFAQERVAGIATIETVYLTRAWLARRA